MWPSNIATENSKDYLRFLEDRWQARHDANGSPLKRPLWTYFDVAEAHQWLLLDRPERAWKTVEWFWAHQDSPNMFTWWEGATEENSFGNWAAVRGWVRPHGVAPHYWTAAEMALLQMDMLANADPRHRDAIVIGKGIPTKWIDSHIRVKNLLVDDTWVDWEWDTKTLKVTLKGKRTKVLPAETFPKEAKVLIAHQ